ncbi:MAG: (Fe-S)-binding protein [Polyangiaceae bacterium]
MNPLAITAILFATLTAFAFSAWRRWKLLRVGTFADRFNALSDRLGVTWRYAFQQEKMDYYKPAGIAHKLIFTGFIVLTIRTIILVGRGFYSGFSLFILDHDSALGKAYDFSKDCVAVLVLFGVSAFFYFRVIKPQKRLTHSKEALLILGIISTMMIADMTYDGASLVLAARNGDICSSTTPKVSLEQCGQIANIILPFGKEHVDHELTWSAFPAPAGSLMAVALKKASPQLLIVLAHAGFWVHVSLVFIFLNLLPHSKHFHVITGIPNVFFSDLRPRGRLEPLAKNTEELMEKMSVVFELPEPTAGTGAGVARVDHFSWKSILDFYTCTECGRCSDNCPAHRTGKILSPKHLTLALRDHLYDNEANFVEKGMASQHAPVDPAAAAAAEASGHPLPEPLHTVDLVPNVIHPDVLWACTSCRACEEQCPVMISYVDKIVDMRRNLVLVKGEFPHTLQKPFQGMEVNGNPWNLSRMDRAAWSDGLGIPMMAEKPDAKVLYWVGCAASYDDRAKKIARATAKLLQAAGVDFAILGQEENCTGDPARRAGNEVLFATLAEGNAEVLNTYKEQGGVRTVITACPHCFNTLKNEYPDFGATLDVVHHTDYLLGLLAEKKLVASAPVAGKVVYHDSCYLGRYNGIYDSPREILRRIPGVELVEPDYWTKSRGLCCGAGGAQMFMEEQNNNRVNVKRTLQLIDTGARTVASACPFCMTMLTDGLKSESLEDKVKQMDIAELLEQSCLVERQKPSEQAAAE